MVATSEILLYSIISILGVFFLILFIYLLYRFYSKRSTLVESQSLIKNDYLSDRRYSSMPLSKLENSGDIDLAEKVNAEKTTAFLASREAAFVYLQFYMRSNQDKIFKSIEHLPIIGSQLDRNWFQVKQILNEENGEVSKYKLILIDRFESKSSPKKKFLENIGESMSIERGELIKIINDLFVSLKHPHVLMYDTAEVNFDQDRVLYIQDYSRDGSLKDLINDACPTHDSKIKYSNETTKKIFLPIKSVKEYGKQILSALIYLKSQMLFPLDNLHAGNVILAYKKRICLVTGFENAFFLDKNRTDIPTKILQKLVRIYLIKSKSDKKKFRKAKNEYELKKIVEVIRFGNLLIEMCSGYEPESLIPQQNIFQNLNTSYESSEIREIIGLINYIFFNADELKRESETYYKEKFALPELEDIYNHDFFKSVKLKDPSLSSSTIGVKQIEFLQYFTGKSELKVRRPRRKSSIQNVFTFESFTNNRLSLIKDQPEQESNEISKTNSQVSQLMPPPPPPPPLATTVVPPPPPPSLFSNVPPPPPPSNDRSSLLNDITKGAKLKKTVTNDRSAPKI